MVRATDIFVLLTGRIKTGLFSKSLFFANLSLRLGIVCIAVRSKASPLKMRFIVK